ncbi:hypothetical protein [Curtobacterium sp. VKM Ac-2922]|nr:hypothetical protein [Curtobacterium sp. VKM Ac-2922]MCJ1714539.1 hypothetical protein [Curtobacterium sp. VKM Ac-2922]
MNGLPTGMLALLIGELPRPAAVLRDAELDSFTRWVEQLPMSGAQVAQ